MNKMGSKRVADYCLTNLDRNPEEYGLSSTRFCADDPLILDLKVPVVEAGTLSSQVGRDYEAN
jgi:hypothetical protein